MKVTRIDHGVGPDFLPKTLSALGGSFDVSAANPEAFGLFPVGTNVRVACEMQDFTFFSTKERGTVIFNKCRYLGITVQFDEPLSLKTPSGVVELPSFNFNPSDLEIIHPRSRIASHLFEEELTNDKEV